LLVALFSWVMVVVVVVVVQVVVVVPGVKGHVLPCTTAK
jgi:hypothetical protein